MELVETSPRVTIYNAQFYDFWRIPRSAWNRAIRSNSSALPMQSLRDFRSYRLRGRIFAKGKNSTNRNIARTSNTGSRLSAAYQQ